MSVASRTVTHRDYQNAVDGQVQAGFSFGQVEDFINACAIEEDEKTALWLRAWRQQPGDVRRTFADAEVLDHAQAWLLRERVEHRRTRPLAVRSGCPRSHVVHARFRQQ